MVYDVKFEYFDDFDEEDASDVFKVASYEKVLDPF